MIKINGLIKNYGKEKVLNIDTFSFLDKSCYLLIGENGSGKSTLIKVLLGIIKKTNGDIESSFKKLSYIPERFYFPYYLSVYTFLENLACIKGIKNYEMIIDRLTKKWNIDKNKRIDQLSKGMKQKVLIIQAIMEEADLYIFDEPLNGLDIESQNEFIDMIKKLLESNKTIIISTHYDKYFLELGAKKVYLKDGKLYE